MYPKDKSFISRMFDEISPVYDLLNHLFSLNQDKLWRKQAVKYLVSKDVKARNILDLASGSGDLAVEFLRMNPERIFSVDISSEMLKVNREKLNQVNRSAVNVPVAAEAAKLPFPDEFFDVAGISFGIRNFDSLQLCLEEIHRVLKPGGRLAVIEMFGSESEALRIRLFRLYFNKVVPRIGRIISKSSYAYDYLYDSVETFMTVEEFSDLLTELGFEIEKVRNNFLGIVNTIISSKR